MHLRLVVIGAIALGLAACKESDETSSNLFLNDVPPPKLVNQHSQPTAWVKESRLARINAKHFFDKAFEPSSSVAVVFNLFDEVEFPVFAKSHAEYGTGTVVWRGADENGEAFRIALAVDGRRVNGEVHTSTETVRITPVSDDWHLIQRLDVDEMPPEADPVEITGQEESAIADRICDDAPGSDEPRPGPGKGPRIRLLIAYTDAAAAAGNINVYTDLLLEQLTEIWTSAQPNFIVIPELAHVVQVPYAETGNSYTDLFRLKDTSDGFLDELHNLRDVHRADMVALIAENILGDCGRGFFVYPHSPANAQYAFSVIPRRCALSKMSFAHELGHNLSLHHDRYSMDTIKAGRYHYGYSNINLSLRSVMAYPEECIANGTTCKRYPTYSHPYLFMKDKKIGRPIGTADAAHNRDMFCGAANSVMQYR